MATLTTALTYDCTTVGNWKQWTQGIATAILTLGWVSTGDSGAMSATNNFGSATITNLSASAGTYTITYSGATNNLAVGAKILMTGLTTTTALNGTYQVIATLPSSTTFTFVFGTATIGSGAETGTVTMTYGYATITNVPDQTFAVNGTFGNLFPQGGQIRFRGAYVSATPTFTNLQTTNNLTTCTFATPHGLDSTRAIGQALNVSAVANANFTFLNTNPGSGTTGTNGWPITAMTLLTVTINTGSSPRADIASTAVSAGIGTPQYQTTAASNVNPVFDTCTYQGDMYAINSNQLGNFNGTPGNSPTSQPGFKRFGFDMFKSNDTLSSTNPLYFKILFGANNTAASGIASAAPAFYFGSASDGGGNITTNYNYPASTTVPFSPTNGSSTNTGSAVWESDFSGTSGRLSFILWRGFTAGTSFSTAPTTVMIIDRSKDNSGNDTDAYWTFCFSGRASGNAGGDVQQSILKPGTGGAGIIIFQDNASLNFGSICTLNYINGGAGYNNQLPVFPIFPVIGYMGNPLLGGVTMKNADTSEGALVSVTLYGSQHNYLMTVRGGAQSFGPNGNNAAGIRWE